MKIAVTGIIHNNSINYFNDYIKSIYRQTFTDFDLLLFNQNIYDGRGLYLDSSLSLSEAKKFTVDYIKDEGYDILIFTDTDDFLDENYVKSLVKALGKYNIAFTDVCVYYDNYNMIYSYFSKCKVPDTIDYHFIDDKNCIGWGNSAIRLGAYNGFDRFEEQFSKCDWWFFKEFMRKNNCEAKFVKESFIYYRQHRNNILGLNSIVYKLWGEK